MKYRLIPDLLHSRPKIAIFILMVVGFTKISNAQSTLPDNQIILKQGNSVCLVVKNYYAGEYNIPFKKYAEIYQKYWNKSIPSLPNVGSPPHCNPSGLVIITDDEELVFQDREFQSFFRNLLAETNEDVSKTINEWKQSLRSAEIVSRVWSGSVPENSPPNYRLIQFFMQIAKIDIINSSEIQWKLALLQGKMLLSIGQYRLKINSPSIFSGQKSYFLEAVEEMKRKKKITTYDRMLLSSIYAN